MWEDKILVIWKDRSPQGPILLLPSTPRTHHETLPVPASPIHDQKITDNIHQKPDPQRSWDQEGKSWRTRGWGGGRSLSGLHWPQGWPHGHSWASGPDEELPLRMECGDKWGNRFSKVKWQGQTHRVSKWQAGICTQISEVSASTPNCLAVLGAGVPLQSAWPRSGSSQRPWEPWIPLPLRMSSPNPKTRGPSAQYVVPVVCFPAGSRTLQPASHEG